MATAALMGFFEEHNEREAVREQEAKVAARYPQNAPAKCAECGETKPDVLLGICAACFDDHLGARHHAVRDRLDGMGRY